MFLLLVREGLIRESFHLLVDGKTKTRSESALGRGHIFLSRQRKIDTKCVGILARLCGGLCLDELESTWTEAPQGPRFQGEATKTI